jgi:hypothetical protein
VPLQQQLHATSMLAWVKPSQCTRQVVVSRRVFSSTLTVVPHVRGKGGMLAACRVGAVGGLDLVQPPTETPGSATVHVA